MMKLLFDLAYEGCVTVGAFMVADANKYYFRTSTYPYKISNDRSCVIANTLI